MVAPEDWPALDAALDARDEADRYERGIRSPDDVAFFDDFDRYRTEDDDQ